MFRNVSKLDIFFQPYYICSAELVDGGTVEGWFPLIRENETARLGEVRVSVRYSRLSMKLPHLMGRTVCSYAKAFAVFLTNSRFVVKRDRLGKDKKLSNLFSKLQQL
jgi:hypothetical protein